MTQSRGRRLYGTSGDIVGASASRPRTRILALTGEVQLHRLLRSLLEPNGCKVVATAVPREGPATNDPFDIVIVDLESLHLDVISRAVRAYPDAQIIAICRAYREADCIAVLDMGADYLPRPFRALDLSARVRVAELRQFKAKGHRRYYRRGSFVMDLFDRKVVLAGEPLALGPFRIGRPDSSCTRRRERGDVRSNPRGIGPRKLGSGSSSRALVRLSSAAQNRARPAATRPAADRIPGSVTNSPRQKRAIRCILSPLTTRSPRSA